MAAPSATTPSDIERVLDRFDQAWRGGAPPRLEEFLPPAGPQRLRLLEELIKIDLECRWRARSGVGLRLENYAAQHPELAAAGPPPLDLIAAEYRVRHCWGDQPNKVDYLARFPQHGMKLRETLARVDADLAQEFAAEPKAPALRPVPAPAPRPPAQAPTHAALLTQLRQYELLTPAQLQEVETDLHRRCPDARALGKELLGRGWLTPYQANQLLQGRGDALRLGPHLLLERLGEGGTGQVFRARHLRMQRQVAVKIIKPELVADAEVLGRFYREIQVVSKLDHPNVVHAFDAGPEEAVHLLVMEYVEGTNLGRMVKQGGPLPIEQACSYVRQAALGLQHAHERGLVHRDIKPQNLVMSVRDGLVKVLDLGLARLRRAPDDAVTADEENTSSLTPVGSVMMGTADYMAPEQALDFHRADIRADIYSLGCTLYFLLAGQPPFPGGTIAQKVARHMQAEPPPVESLRPETPPELAKVVRRLMAKRPKDRYQTPAEVAQALASLRFTPAVKQAWPRRRRLVVAGVAALLLLLGVGSLLFRRPKEPSPLEGLVLPESQRGKHLGPELVALLDPGINNTDVGGFGIAFSPDGKTLWQAGRPPHVQQWDFTGAPTAQGKGATPAGVTKGNAVLTADGRRLGIGSKDGTASFWELGDNPQIAVEVPKGAEVRSLALDGRKLAIGRLGGPVEIWGPTDSKPRLLAKDADDSTGCYALSFSADGTRLACALGKGNIALWDLSGSQPTRLALFPSGGDGCGAVALSADGKRLASGQHHYKDNSRSVRLWDVSNVTQPLSVRDLRWPVPDEIAMLAFSPDGKTLAAASVYSHIVCYDTATGADRFPFRQVDPPIAALLFAPDSRHVAIASQSGRVFIYRMPR